MKKDNPYKVPENYFDNLGEQIKDKIKKEENLLESKSEKRSLMIQLKPYMWMAASIFTLVIAARLILSVSISPEYKISSSNFGISQTAESTDSISSEEDAIFFDDLTEVSSEDIINYLSDNDIDTDILLANL
ncbi:hypothetical protein EO244_03540 [Ancylomarina salipaludis]|uniref:Uncharacterized protein n=1 Tax=Ancylomarina salipaludis TaxID=2501299 RepID=A0A4Q1JPR7_9BACT|nr:hypothetical protein [Ancylomarina salipaludis]RXQ96714.1 hypothetical protein EO244_03540 [Ancylomarina salipaludis]